MKFKHIRIKWHEEDGWVFWIAYRNTRYPIPQILAQGPMKLTRAKAGYALPFLMPMFEQLDKMYEEKKR